MIRLPGLKGIGTGFDESLRVFVHRIIFQLPAVLGEIHFLGYVLCAALHIPAALRGVIFTGLDQLSGHSVGNHRPVHGQNKIIDLLIDMAVLILHASLQPLRFKAAVGNLKKCLFRFKHPLRSLHTAPGTSGGHQHTGNQHTYQYTFFHNPPALHAYLMISFYHSLSPSG